jgi:hypothetical protein
MCVCIVSIVDYYDLLYMRVVKLRLSLDVVAKLKNAFNSKICNYHVKQPNTMGFDMSERPLIVKELKQT